MSVFIITSDLQKGYNSKSRNKIRESLFEWFTAPEVQLDPSRYMIIAGNLQFNKTQQFISLTETIAQSMKEHNVRNLQVLWIRGNRDYRKSKTVNFHLHLKEQESIRLIHKNESIYNNFHHLSDRYPIITHDGIWISGFDDWYDDIPILASDLDDLPRKIKDKNAHEYLKSRKEHSIKILLKNLRESRLMSKVRKRIVVSHFPYCKDIIDDPTLNTICFHSKAEYIEQQINAWIFGHSKEFCHQIIDNVTYMCPGSTPTKPHAIILKIT